ncbi:MFS transporter [Georgenia halophila]|uniref:MFS transporter n=1 Tax=Georgenia halophila TaxID=620889 RepID=A0ABP8LDQ0_9MICO
MDGGPGGGIGSPGRARPTLRTVLVALCVTEIVSWGVLYYAFPVLAPRISDETGWSTQSIMAAFSAALVVAAVVGVPVGRMLDRRGPRLPMTAGSVLSAGALVLIALAPSLPLFALGWMLAGVAMAGVLYPPAFAALTRWYGPRRLTALTAVTLVAGLASTVFAPLTEALAGQLGWRQVYLVLAGGLAVVTIPLHAVALRRPWPSEAHQHSDRADTDGGYARAVTRSRPFLFLVAGMTVGALAIFAALINLVPLITERGLSSGVAALALGVGGVGQVAGRLGYGALTRHLSVRARTLVIYGLVAVTTAAFATVPGQAFWFLAVAVGAGVARGIATLLQATAVTDRWGPRAYGRLSGVLTAPIMLATALAPWVGATVAGLLGGYAAMYLVLAAIAVAAVLMLAASVPKEAVLRRRTL